MKFSNLGMVDDVPLKPLICPTCCAIYAIPESTHDNKYKNGSTWYCPNGHEIGFAKSQADLLREQVSELRQEKSDLEASNRKLHRELRAKKKKTKTKV